MKTPDEYLQQSGAFGSQTLIRKEDAIAAIRAAVKDACREHREICAAKILEWADDIKDRRSAIDVALSAPEPTLS